jgi:hypothetical protein
MELLGDVGEVESCFGPFGDVVMLAQDRCTVCAKRSTGMENYFGYTRGTS